MELVLGLCAAAHEIKNLMEQAFPNLSYELLGENRDYTMVVGGINEEDADAIVSRLKDVIYGDGEFTLTETLVELLKEKGVTISVAESCTGGMLSSAIVDVSGSSKVFYEGVVTYSNDSKIRRLNVREDTLNIYGAVSMQTAAEMALGLKNINNYISVSVTGIAGPQGGTSEKPVGLVYIAIANDFKTQVYRNIFSGTRDDIRAKAKNTALFYAIKYLKTLGET